MERQCVREVEGVSGTLMISGSRNFGVRDATTDRRDVNQIRKQYAVNGTALLFLQDILHSTAP